MHYRIRWCCTGTGWSPSRRGQRRAQGSGGEFGGTEARRLSSLSRQTDPRARRRTGTAPARPRHGDLARSRPRVAPLWPRGAAGMRFFPGGSSGGAGSRRSLSGVRRDEDVTIVLPRRRRKAKMRNSNNKTFASSSHTHFAEIVQEQCTGKFILPRGGGKRQGGGHTGQGQILIS